MSGDSRRCRALQRATDFYCDKFGDVRAKFGVRTRTDFYCALLISTILKLAYGIAIFLAYDTFLIGVFGYNWRMGSFLLVYFCAYNPILR
jgi:hypothetical protein